MKVFHPILLVVVNILPGNTQVNKENHLTKETVSVPVPLKVMYHIHVCGTIFYILCVFICVFSNHDQSANIDEVSPALHMTCYFLYVVSGILYCECRFCYFYYLS